MVIGVLIVSVCYFLVNLSFFSVLSYHEILSAQAVALVRQCITQGKYHSIFGFQGSASMNEEVWYLDHVLK